MNRSVYGMGDRIVLGLDPATRASGWAVLQGDRVLAAGVFQALGFEEADRIGQLAGIYQWVRTGVVDVSPALVAVETVWHGPNAQTTIRLAEVGAVVRLAAHRAGAAVVDVSPAERCQALSLPGTAGKKRVLGAVNAIYGLKLKDHNAADAVAIAAAGAAIFRQGELARRAMSDNA